MELLGKVNIGLFPSPYPRDKTNAIGVRVVICQCCHVTVELRPPQYGVQHDERIGVPAACPRCGYRLAHASGVWQPGLLGDIVDIVVW